MKLKPKTKIIISSIITLLTGASLATTFTLAWLSLNVKIDQITLIAGQAEARVEGYLFKRNYDVSGMSTIVPVVNQTPDLVARQLSSTHEQLIFTFKDDNHEIHPYPEWDLMDLYFNEHGLNAFEIPSFFLELQVYTIVEESYIRLSIWLDLLEEEMNPDFNDFSYRYHLAENNLSNPLEYATPEHIDTLANKELTSLYDGYNPSTGIVLEENGTNYFTLEVSPQDVNFYEQYFQKSLIAEFTIDPVTFYEYLINTPNIVNTSKSFGLCLCVRFEYSLVPF